MAVNLSSKGKRILLVSDVHQEVHKLERIIKAEAPDITACLGDWFDSFTYDGPEFITATCSFLKKNIPQDNFFSLLGNHDVNYFYKNRYALCSGYTQDKDKLILDCLGKQIAPIREKLLWYLWIDDFLCTHAGVHPYYLPHGNYTPTKEMITKWLDEQIKFAQPTLESGGFHWLYGAGAARGGRQNYGGIDWLDFNSEFEPIDGLNQIVGHTAGRSIRAHQTFGGANVGDATNICIDCHLNEYLIIHNGKLEVKSYADLTGP